MLKTHNTSFFLYSLKMKSFRKQRNEHKIWLTSFWFFHMICLPGGKCDIRNHKRTKNLKSVIINYWRKKKDIFLCSENDVWREKVKGDNSFYFLQGRSFILFCNEWKSYINNQIQKNHKVCSFWKNITERKNENWDTCLKY